MAYIYKITNLVNGKIYIGQTSMPLDERFRHHVHEAFTQKSNRPLYKAMRKYGKDNFIINCVEEVLLEDLNSKETYYISYYKSYAPLGFGYNATLGGEGNRTVDYQLVYRLWDQGLSIAEICKVINVDRYCIRYILKQHIGYSEKEARRRGNIYQHSLRKKKVYQYDTNGNFINEFNSVDTAAAFLSCSVKNLQAALTCQSRTACGYQWSYYKFDKLESLDYKVRKYKQKVYEITISGEILAEYESAAEAARVLNLNITENRLRLIIRKNGIPRTNDEKILANLKEVFKIISNLLNILM